MPLLPPRMNKEERRLLRSRSKKWVGTVPVNYGGETMDLPREDGSTPDRTRRSQANGVRILFDWKDRRPKKW